MQCTIIAPHDAPAVKMERTRGYGAELVFSTPAAGENREVAAAALAERFSATSGRRPLPTTGLNPHRVRYSGGVVLGRTLLHPFDDADVILGQGTLALELFEQHAEASAAGGAGGAGGGRVAPLSRLLVPTGGGGMAGGCCLARDAYLPISPRISPYLPRRRLLPREGCCEPADAGVGDRARGVRRPPHVACPRRADAALRHARLGAEHAFLYSNQRSIGYAFSCIRPH